MHLQEYLKSISTSLATRNFDERKHIKKTTQTSSNGYQYLIFSALAFSLMTVCVKKLDGRLPIAQLIFFRALISILITRIMMYKDKVSPLGKNKKLLFIRGFLGTIALFCIFKALSSLSLATATVIQYTYPIFTIIFAWFLLGETIKKRIIYAILFGLAGIILVVNSNSEYLQENELGIIYILIALAGAIFTALAYVSVRALSTQEHPLVIIFYFPLVSILFTIPLILQNPLFPSITDWAWILGIGVFTQIGQIYITRGLTKLPAGPASCLNYSQVLFAALWGALIFSDKLNLLLVTGAICVLISTLISYSAKSDL